jgi:hypothetical protein
MKTEKPILIGLTGRKRAGKDSVAAAIERNYGSNRVLTTSFAKPIRDFVASLLGVTRNQLEAVKDESVTLPGNVKIFPRVAMQTLGTEWGRALHPDLWVARCENWLDDIEREGARLADYVLVTDVRFDNEAEMIRRRGGYVVQVTRPGADGSGDTHASELGVSHRFVDIVLQNNGSLGDLALDVSDVLMPYIKRLKNFEEIRAMLRRTHDINQICYINSLSERLAA